MPNVALVLASALISLWSSTSVATGAPAPQVVTDPCSLLSVAKVSSLTGRTYTGATHETIAKGVESCHYAAAEGYALSVTIYSAPNKSTLDSLVFDIGGAKSATPTKDVGDQAFASAVGVVARFRDHLLEVASPATTGSSKAAIPGYVAIAKAVIAAMH
jgi:hypothetical protein